MPAQRKYPEELRERAVKMVFEIRDQEGKGHGEIARVAGQLGVHREALRTWIRQAEIDGGARPGTTTEDSRRIAELEREVRELRRANVLRGSPVPSSVRPGHARTGDLSAAGVAADSLTCRIEGVTCMHAYALIDMSVARRARGRALRGAGGVQYSGGTPPPATPAPPPPARPPAPHLRAVAPAG